MQLKTITLSNFRCFTKPQTFKIPETGLYLITGRNQVNTALGANGVGKSSLFESVHWCLFGKSSRNLKAKSIVNWKMKNCAVTLIGKEFKLIRTQNKNSLKLNGKEVDQETLNKELTLYQPTFISSLYFPQFAPSFLDLSAEAKMELLVSILDLHLWDEASTTAKDEATELREFSLNLEGRIESMEDQLAAKSDDLALLEKEWETEHKKALKVHSDLIVMTRKKLVGLQSITFKRVVPNMENKLNAAIKVMNEARAALTLATHKLEATRLDLDTFKTIGPTCPICRQTMSMAHKVKEQNKLTAAETKAAAAYELAEHEDNVAIVNYDKLFNEQTRQKREAAEIERQAQKNQHNITQLEAEMMHLARAQAKEQHSVNPYTMQRKKESAARFKLKMKLADAKKEKAEHDAQHTHRTFWVKGFKEVRLMVIEEVLAQLEAEVNQTIVELGLAGWQIKFDIEKENKTGGVKRGFSVLILSPDNTDYVPWESWSGGETQRLRMAGAMGMANLINARSGVAPNVEFWDEPSNGLSAEGIEQMLDALKERAIRYDRAILIADHRSLDYGGFANTYTITRNADSVSIA